MTSSAGTGLLHDRLYQAYASQHAGQGDGRAAAFVYRRDIRPWLPPPAEGPVVDIGCGQGELVRLMVADGYDAEGVDVSPEQVSIAHAAGLDRVQEGDYRDRLGSRPGELAVVTATDVLEHLAKEEVLDVFDQVVAALLPGGVFVARVPNAVSPFGGHIRYADFTHETWYTQRSVRQLAAAAGFGSVVTRACPPVAHGLVSAARVAAWKAASAFCKAALAAETGVLRGHIVTQNLTFAARKAGGKDNVRRVGPGRQPARSRRLRQPGLGAGSGGPRSWRPGPRLVMVTLAMLVVLGGVTVTGSQHHFPSPPRTASLAPGEARRLPRA